MYAVECLTAWLRCSRSVGRCGKVWEGVESSGWLTQQRPQTRPHTVPTWFQHVSQLRFPHTLMAWTKLQPPRRLPVTWAWRGTAFTRYIDTYRLHTDMILFGLFGRRRGDGRMVARPSTVPVVSSGPASLVGVLRSETSLAQVGHRPRFVLAGARQFARRPTPTAVSTIGQFPQLHSV